MKLSNVLSYVWLLPLNICGLVWKSVKKDSIITRVDHDAATQVLANIYLMQDGGGVSLGRYIFVNQRYSNLDFIIKHECGHVKQSKIFGPVYLLVIGIPSIIHAWLNNYIGCCKKHKEGYYHFYTEHWANKLAGIN